MLSLTILSHIYSWCFEPTPVQKVVLCMAAGTNMNLTLTHMVILAVL